ncbi:hypothetical protein BATDEDRAFT_14121 [Batrachochytrium dendrobatidis JAM81]|uniref:cAMP-dependent protein kinase n=1 Tax=Batrachochytrium dendrobatidis (strain JAM81 / FGSC 10211) TaxID=684364 RepID=F4PBK5_BATDJ|nr:uncharacterized protein BATDEDRAFT_14121 [Batrachochytrium dendrobatidis JAM81]EGF77461.1 hypothetical protein BATDEDRAFT_14121 [Batrachochytrium dendrobatidis JAM81]|eukprot:XP_006681874.1 hypothetical protein BATDEDRAFT_14121 [Batrachochytrium dendrobatidis JAM81]
MSFLEKIKGSNIFPKRPPTPNNPAISSKVLPSNPQLLFLSKENSQAARSENKPLAPTTQPQSHEASAGKSACLSSSQTSSHANTSSATNSSPSATNARGNTQGSPSSSHGSATTSTRSTSTQLALSKAAHCATASTASPNPSILPQLSALPIMLTSTPKKTYGLADLQINRTLGTGSFGRVHLVKLKSNNKFYAMKVLRKTDIVKMRQVEHTINEKTILEKLEFPFLVSLLTTFQDSANLYFILEYIHGGELFSYLRKCVRFPNHVARFYAAEVVLAFEELHSRNIIYRDLKPENLLITAQGHIKITDFGFAKIVPDVTWTLCGTPDYLAPEIIQSKGYSRAVDWWALGVLIFEMVAGYPPFYHEEHMKIYENILASRPKFSSVFDPYCKDIVKRLLQLDLTKRFGNLKGGVSDIKNHRWFAGLDWAKLLALDIPAPYIPPIKGDGDTSNFDVYSEDYAPYGSIEPDVHRDKFKEF